MLKLIALGLVVWFILWGYGIVPSGGMLDFVKPLFESSTEEQKDWVGFSLADSEPVKKKKRW